MSNAARILVVDDVAINVKMLAEMLTFENYDVVTAQGGREALARVRSERPDLVLLDVMMPDMNGYEVCRSIRSDPATEMLPVVLVTALDPAAERVKGIEAGADDFLSKPINQPELLARVRSLLRVKAYYDTIQDQARQLADWNRTLEQRVQDQVTQLERMGRLKGFFSPQVAEMILSGGADELLKPHRREITVVFLDLRGFTTFTEAAEPEEVMGMLAEFHELVGRLVLEHGGTVEYFAGDGMMIFFNDPIPLPDATMQAVRMCVALRTSFKDIRIAWDKRGFMLGLGAGMSHGYATLGTIGFEGRRDYAAIGSIVNLAARLCGEAKEGQILISQNAYARVEALVQAEAVEPLTLKGFSQPIRAYDIVALRVSRDGAHDSASGS
jgi:adenylate cyclase